MSPPYARAPARISFFSRMLALLAELLRAANKYTGSETEG
jgi:hypothetical protein